MVFTLIKPSFSRRVAAATAVEMALPRPVRTNTSTGALAAFGDWPSEIKRK